MASLKFTTVLRYFKSGLWTASMVKEAVRKKWITEGEYKTITGKEYNKG